MSTRDLFIVVQKLGHNQTVTQENSNCIKPLQVSNVNDIGNLLKSISNLKYSPNHHLNTRFSSRRNHHSTILLLDFLNIVPSEVLYLIALYLDDESLFSLLTCSSRVKNILDDEEFWQMKCELIFERKVLTLTNESYKKIYETCVRKKPFYHLKDSAGNVFNFLETTDCSLLPFFDFGLVYVNPRELVELSDLLISGLSSIENVFNNFVKFSVMGITQVGIAMDMTHCQDLSDSECQLKISQVQEIARRFRFRTFNIFYINYKTNQGIPEMLKTISEIPPRKGQVLSKPLRMFIFDIEHMESDLYSVDLIAKVALGYGNCNIITLGLRILGESESIDLMGRDIKAMFLHSDKIINDDLPRIFRASVRFEKPTISSLLDEQICILNESPQKKTTSFKCQVTSLELELMVGDLLLCIGGRFKNLVRIKTLISTIQKKSGQIIKPNPTSITKSETGMIEVEIIAGSLCMVAPLSEHPECGRILFYSLPSNINVENFQSYYSTIKINILEQFTPGAWAICKSISND